MQTHGGGSIGWPVLRRSTQRGGHCPRARLNRAQTARWLIALSSNPEGIPAVGFIIRHHYLTSSALGSTYSGGFMDMPVLIIIVLLVIGGATALLKGRSQP
jgi:hypothetical protein